MTSSMKKALNILFALLALLLVWPLSSCKKDDEDTTKPNSLCYISSFTLGTLTYYRTSTNESGEEVTTTYTYAGSYYPMAIDQIARQQETEPSVYAGTIYSTKQLLVGTDPTIVPVTIAGEGNYYYRPLSDESGWTAFTSGDNVDFSTPVVFRATATDGGSSRDYLVTISIRSNDPNGYTWEQMMPADGGTSMLAGRGERRAVAWKSGLAIVSIDGSNALHLTTATSATAPTWSDTPCTGADGAEVGSLQKSQGKLWMHTSGGALLRSADGVAWETVAQTDAGTTVQLLAASPSLLYATVNGVMSCSEDGQAWTAVNLDDDENLFPFTNHAATYYTQSNGTARVILTGSCGETTATWYREEDEDEPWLLISRTGDNDYNLPWSSLKEGSLVDYCSKIIAIGKSASTYYSTDNGVTWKEYTELTLGSGQQAADGEHIAATVAGEYIWIIAGPRIWRARLNSYGE